MRAIVVPEYTRFDQASVAELPDPSPGPGEVVVDIEASDVNFADILYIEGKYQKTLEFPFSPGLAGAGRIAAVGGGVPPELLGRRVLALPEHGTYAEKLCVPGDFCFPVPDDMTSVVAAAFGLVYQTAYFALTDRAAMAEGDNVLVLGAGGGIGMAALQLARALGAKTVIAATRGAGDASSDLRPEADTVIDAGMDDLRDGLKDAVLAATDGHGADVVIDPVGGSVSAAALRALAWHGRLVVIGFASGEIPKFAGNYLLVKNISVSGMQWTDYRARQLERVRAAQAHLFDLWRAGKLEPTIDAIHPLDRYVDALRALKSGAARGKHVLAIATQSPQ